MSRTRRTQQRRAARDERLRRERERETAARRRALLVRLVALAIAVPVVVLVAIRLGGPLAAGGGGVKGSFPRGSVPPQRLTDLNRAAEAAGCALSNAPSEGRRHTTGHVTYRTNPPTSGNHHPVPAGDGAYTRAPGVEHLVHALEHGRVIFWFRPDASRRQRGDLKALFDEDSTHLILTPNTTHMPYAVAASAWTHLLGCPTFNTRVFDALRAFKQAYRDKGPERVP